jgi:SAM-dependent methyltransferase
MEISFTENLSNVPTDGKMYGFNSIKNILENIEKRYETLSKIPKNPQSLNSILEITNKLIKMLIQKQRSYKILELNTGEESGLLSYFLASVARAFHRENTVHCVSANALNQEWLSLLLEYGDSAENLHLHITDAATQSLQENYFDFCVLNNVSSNEVLNNAIRVLAPGGVLLLVTQDGKVVEQEITLKEKQSAHGQAINLQKGELKVLWQQATEKLANIENSTKEELSQIVKDLSYLEKLAAKLFCEIEDADLKYKLNQIKEKVLNILYVSHVPQTKRDILEIAAQITLDYP